MGKFCDGIGKAGDFDKGKRIGVGGDLSGAGEECVTIGKARFDVLAIAAERGFRAGLRQGAGDVLAIERQVAERQERLPAICKMNLQRPRTAAMAQALHIGCEFRTRHRLEQTAAMFADELGLPGEFANGAGGEDNGSLAVDLEQEIGIGEGKTKQTCGIDHNRSPASREIGKSALRNG